MKPIDDYVMTADGVRLFVRVVGHGPTTVVVPNGYYMFDALAPLANRYRMIFCDPRNRGRSDSVTDSSKLENGVHHDVDDFEAIRVHHGVDRIDLIGHSYMGVVVVLYALKYPQRVGRVVQIGAMPPDDARQYPVHLTNADGTLRDVLGRLGQLQKERASYDADDFCKTFWAILRTLYVADPADADKLKWEPCHLPNETNFMKQWTEHVLPSIENLQLTADELAKVVSPVLAIHGRRDRSSPYGGGRDWALRLPNARLVTVDNAAHVPWIEDPKKVSVAIETFLDGNWPDSAERVTAVE